MLKLIIGRHGNRWFAFRINTGLKRKLSSTIASLAFLNRANALPLKEALFSPSAGILTVQGKSFVTL